MSKRILVTGVVTVRQGDKVLIREAINHFVDAGLKGLISTLIVKCKSGDSSKYWHLWSYGWNIYLGSDVSTATITTMTALVSPIGTPPGTAPNSKDGTPRDGSADGDWYVTLTATWNAGTISGTLGELGLYMNAPDKSDFDWEAYAEYPAAVMVSRLSSTDLDFSSFVIDAGEPLTVEWKVKFTFA